MHSVLHRLGKQRKVLRNGQVIYKNRQKSNSQSREGNSDILAAAGQNQPSIAVLHDQKEQISCWEFLVGGGNISFL
jgi:hypothetical protein